MAATVLASVAQPVFDWLSDGRGHPWLLSTGVFTAGLGIALAGIAPTYPLILAAVALSGVGVAGFHPDAARTTRVVAGGRKATAHSVFVVGGNTGYAAGPLIATPLFVALGVAASPSAADPLGTHRDRAVALERAPVRAVRPARAPLHRRRRAAWTRQRPGPGAFSLLTGVVVARSVTFFTLVSFVPLCWVGHLDASATAGNSALTLLLLGGFSAVLVLLTPLPGWDLATAAALGVSVYLPFGVMSWLGQAYLWRRLGTASGVTLGLSMSVGGLAAPVFGAYADATSLSHALSVLIVVPLLGATLTATLPPIDRGERDQEAGDVESA